MQRSKKANYQQLLKSTTMQSVGAAGASAAPARVRGHRNVFIQLAVGPSWPLNTPQAA